MLLPKVLIIGQPFNKKNGGGITLTNLFTGWDKDRIAVAATGHVMRDVTTDVCDTYYQLGVEEFKWRFPFNLFQKKYHSGLKSITKKTGYINNNRRKGLRRTIINQVFYPTLGWIGVFHSSVKVCLSDGFIKWIDEYKPEVLYMQVSTYDGIVFAHKLLDYLNKPAVIHMMDDWPSTISQKGLLRRYWQYRIDKEFKRLLDRIDTFLSISDAMSSEYKIRYRKDFIAFHNPIDIPLWTTNQKNDYELSDDHVRVLFSGRIGVGTAESLVDLAQAVEELSESGIRIKLYIQSPSRRNKLADRVKSFKSLVFNPVAEYSELPGIFSSADILVITNDFDNKSINYLRYSMPTKASEYMISGTPVLIYSHSETAVTKFFSENRCGYCVTDQNLILLKDALLLLIKDKQLRNELGVNAVRIAKELFDAKIVRTKFHNLIKETCMRHIIKSESTVYPDITI
jgi:glycosyltransferase involved in cell wall biosynthesis